MNPHNSILNLHALAPEVLMYESALVDALAEVEAAINGTSIESVITELLSKPYLLEFLMSASPAIANRITSYVLDHFPETAEAFSSSLASDLLQRFLLSLFGLRRSFPDEICLSIEEYRQLVGLAPLALAEISAMLINDALIVPSVSNNTRHKGKRAKRAGSITITIDVDPFKKLDLSVPNTKQAAQQLATDILQNLKYVLQSFLLILCRPDLSSIFQSEYLSYKSAEGTDASAAQPSELSTTTEELETPSSAYPAVQPMKAAQYFDSAVGFGEWRLLVSARGIQDLRDARRDNPNNFKIIVKKMKELSNGHFSDDNQKRLNGSNTEVPIYEAKMTRDQRLVYQVDCVPQHNTDGERQVLRIFGIYSHAQLDRFWDSVGAQLARKGKEYRQRCNFRNPPYHRGDNVIMPAQFPKQELADADQESSVLDLPHEDLGELHKLLVLEKFIDFSQALLNSIIADLSVTHIFAVSPQEKEIIEHNSACYVLGRSGTGKTTTMLFKMLRIETAWAGSVDLPKPRQLFVTQSRVLAGKVEEYFSKLMESFVTASHTPRELSKLAQTKHTQQEEKPLLDMDDVMNWRDDLPERFSLLEDSHFPLFITFDKLCKLLEADIAYSKTVERNLVNAAVFHDDLDFKSMKRTDLPWSMESEQKQLGLFVSYSVFLQFYWPHFSQSFTKGLDPSLVFSEIMGVIQGSEQALSCADRFLDRQYYENLSHRSQSTFATQRSTIYAIFELYLRRKKAEGHYDAADRTHTILREMLMQGVPGKIDYLYVDEAQDNLLVDALLVRSLCQKPGGLFWAGDTAQTISIGSSFRFDDLKAFLFRIEARGAAATDNLKGLVQPKSFQLAVNYRSHGGIVNCAHSVVELITRFWPYAIDTLAKERGIVDGLKPVFFHGWDTDTVRYEQFLFGTAGNHIEFGAQQCILVRDHVARDKLRERVGNRGIIMTLYESKGLEFNDVLLYNFFENSTADLSQWRIVLGALESGSSLSISAPRFSDTRHAAICNELKCLYVAITRARNNLWIFDCSQKSEPMRMLWSSKDLVRSCIPGSDVPRLAVSSSPQEWGATGVDLFQRKQYLQAMECFERAGLHREVDVCRAYSLRERAQSVPISSQKNGDALAKAAFVAAAEAFITCAEAASKDMERRGYFRIAGECYIKNDDNSRAAELFLRAKEYTLAAQHYRKAGLFDVAVEVIQTHREDIPPDVVESIVDVARLVYFRGTQVAQAKKLFSSDQEALDFAADYHLDVAQATLLQDLGNHADAAEVHLAEGRITEALDIFLDNLADKECARRAADFVIRGLWERLSFGIVPKDAKLDLSVERWLLLAVRLDLGLLNSLERDEIGMFQAIVSNDIPRLRQLGLKFHFEANKPAALLCLDHVHRSPFGFQGTTHEEMISTLEIFHTYARLLHDFTFSPDPCHERTVQKLFAFKPRMEDNFAVPKGTFLYNAIASAEPMVQSDETDDQVRLVPQTELSQVFKQSLSERLRCRVMEENEVCRSAKVLSTCLNALEGSCQRSECPRDHVDPARLNPKWYNDRVRIHLQQILIFQTLHSIDLGQERWWQQRQWLDRLYEALNPYSYRLGSTANLDISHIPEADNGLKVVKDWIRYLIYTSDPGRHSAFMTTFLRVAALGFTFYRKEAFDYIRRALCLHKRPPEVLVRRGGNHKINIMWDFVHAIHGVQPWCLPMGFLFLGHVVREKLPVNISVLCDFVEYICSSLVVTRRSQQKFLLHDITLPRSWILACCANLDTGCAKDTFLQQESLDTLLSLLARIFTGQQAEHLLFEGRNLSQFYGARKSIFIARICRALCLIGYNIVNQDLRHRILKGITSLHVEGHLYPPSYGRYLTASKWGDLASAVQQSMIDSQMDEVVYLCHESKKRYLPPPTKGIRYIVFQHPDEVPALLEAHPTFGMDAKPAEPADSSEGVGFECLEADNAHHQKETIHPNLGQKHSEMDHPGDAEALVTSSGVTRPPDDIVALSKEHIDAARKIDWMYHHVLVRRRESPRGALSEARYRLFLECRAVSEKTEWPRKGYRLLFLGPLPHVLLCLEQAKTCVFQLKAKLKKRLLVSEHLGLEDVQSKMTRTNAVINDLQRLQNALKPKAVIHQRRDLLKLKAYVQEVEALIHGLPCAHELREELHIGIKGIVTEPSCKPKRKPSLCVDDDPYAYLDI